MVSRAKTFVFPPTTAVSCTSSAKSSTIYGALKISAVHLPSDVHSPVVVPISIT